MPNTVKPNNPEDLNNNSYDVVEDGKKITVLRGGYRLAVAPFSFFKSKKDKKDQFNLCQSGDLIQD